MIFGLPFSVVPHSETVATGITAPSNHGSSLGNAARHLDTEENEIHASYQKPHNWRVGPPFLFDLEKYHK